VQSCEQPRDKAAGALIGGRDEAVDGMVLSGNAAASMLLADRAVAGVDDRPTVMVDQTLVIRHRTFTSFRQLTKGAKVIPFSGVRPDRLLKLSLHSD
jgi:hypothetical protein